jgi:hypothetical protein
MHRCFAALAQLEVEKLDVEDLTAVLTWLPDSVYALPQYAAWEASWHTHIVKMFQDVHVLLTSFEQLQHFRHLPFVAVQAWAASDKLVVDSENSVAVAISWWYGGKQGSGASEDQLKQLSGLLRVVHLSHGRTSKAVHGRPHSEPHITLTHATVHQTPNVLAASPFLIVCETTFTICNLLLNCLQLTAPPSCASSPGSSASRRTWTGSVWLWQRI